MQIRIQLFLLFFLIAIVAPAQDLGIKSITVNNQVSVGKLTASGREVFAKQFIFPKSIYYADNGNDDYASVVLREVGRNGKYKDAGYLVNIDLVTGKVNWDKRIHHFNVGFTKDYIAYLYGGDTKIFDKKTGKFLRSVVGNYAYIDKDRNFAITKVSRYIDFTTGESRWHRKIPSETGHWDEFKLVGDSVAYISSKGIHKVRMSDGEGWSYRMKTSYNDASSAIAGGIVMGAMFGAIGGAIFAAAVPSNSYHGYSSNILLDTVSNEVYFSAIKELVKLKPDGTKDWEIELGRNESSMAILLDRGDKIVHINKGLVYYNGIEAWSGRPYVAAYSKKTGQELYKTEFPKGGMRYTSIMKDTLAARIQNKLYKFDISNGLFLDSLKDERSRGYKEADGNKYYTEVDDRLIPFSDLYPGQFVVADDTVAIAVLNKNLGRERTFGKEDLWILQDAYKDLAVLKMGDEVRIVSGNQVIAELLLKGKLKIDGHLLQAICKETLTLVDLLSIR